ncbi:multiple monosaccharide ABC transporter permease [Oharaeibacter diazotrophicus]|uniref:Xylose transport system permease protein XylH n=1 Tax=Oharaeibacter diazotrophicus TaxID=1920512 RepID=A0A4R6RMH0_9HYPH|nr:multiple monosaccharide ABC transporter permease [Oharaeibacter diazotrophicus]TDP87365.1 multiple monosaccharide ABC transporter membrane protein [Oharaeibacter diazotrophicus]BBE70691.1 xylose transport system permease protein XylH [Pleomorphomonas sp. SM30]GLS77439.1 ABC transporter permease [Oharaeibacter diazotrophicus]
MTDTTLPGAGDKKAATPSFGSYLRHHMRQYGMLLALAVIMAFFGFATDGILFRPVNLTNVISQNSYIVIMSLGMLLIIVAGHIDLSVGYLSGFVGAMAATMMVPWGFNPALAFVLCLVVGGAIGAVQGYFVAYQKIPSFIVTLAGMLVFRGLMIALLGSVSIRIPDGFQRIANGFIPDFLGADGLGIALPADLVGGPFHTTSFLIALALAAFLVWLNVRTRAEHRAHGMELEPSAIFVAKNVLVVAAIVALCWALSTYRGILNVLVIMGVLIAFYSFVATRTTIGRRIYALGGNEKATKLSGIDTERLTFYAFVNMGVLSALAGMIYAARLTSATPKAGQGLELDVIAACFIGGASAYGGVGTVVGAVIGAFIMGVMNNGMSIMGIGIDWQQVIKGLVLLAAVFVDIYNRNK